MKLELGIAPDSWGVWFPEDPLQPPYERFLDEVEQAGYRTIELGPYGYLPSNPQTLRSLLDSHRLRLSGGFVFGDMHSPDSWEALEPEVEKTCSLVHALGGEFLALIDAMYTDLRTGEQTAPAELDESQWSNLSGYCNRIGEWARDRYGLRIAFHPHVQTSVEYDHQVVRLLELTDPELVGLCLDTGHLAYTGGDVVAFMREYHQLIPYLHIKSVESSVLSEVRAQGTTFAPAVQQGVFTEPKLGSIDFDEFFRVLDAVAFDGIGIVEQDLYPTDFDRPLPIATSTRQYLRSLNSGVNG